MPKAEKGSLKDLGKKIKSKGLQKLKFYCQMCEKQCRDANGFKCHLTSESHLRQMKVFSENAGSFMDRYSKDFEKMYMDTLRMRHGTSRIMANTVYQEVIQDKAHIHMNATIWLNLTDFCKYLGKMGKCVVEETERGWFVTYIEQNVARLQQQEATLRRLELEKEAEQATSERMEQQRIEAAKALDRAGGVLHSQATKLERPDDPAASASIQLSIKTVNNNGNKGTFTTRRVQGKSVFGNDDDDEDENDVNNDCDKGAAQGRNQEASSSSHKRGAPDSENRMLKSAIVNDDRGDKKAKRDKRDDTRDEHDNGEHEPWLYRGILARIINKEVANGKYFRCKAIVDKVLDDGFSAEVSVFDDGPTNGDVLRLDQDDMETVAPKRSNERVRIVRGKHYGAKAIVTEVNKKACRAVLTLKDGTVLDRIDYDDFSLIA